MYCRHMANIRLKIFTHHEDKLTLQKCFDTMIEKYCQQLLSNVMKRISRIFLMLH